MANESRDDFPAVTADERGMLDEVLRVAKRTEEIAKRTADDFAEHVALEFDRESESLRRLREHDEEIRWIKDSIKRIDDAFEEVRGVRKDIRTLNANVMRNLSDDASREREIGELKAEVASIAKTAGRKAGLSAGGIVSALFLAAWIIAALLGVDPPSLP